MDLRTDLSTEPEMCSEFISREVWESAQLCQHGVVNRCLCHYTVDSRGHLLSTMVLGFLIKKKPQHKPSTGSEEHAAQLTFLPPCFLASISFLSVMMGWNPQPCPCWARAHHGTLDFLPSGNPFLYLSWGGSHGTNLLTQTMDPKILRAPGQLLRKS